MKDYMNMTDTEKENLLKRVARLSNEDQKKMSNSFTEEEKWEDPNSLEPTDYHSFDDYAKALNDDVTKEDEQYIRSRIQVSLLIIGFVILLLVGIIM